VFIERNEYKNENNGERMKSRNLTRFSPRFSLSKGKHVFLDMDLYFSGFNGSVARVETGSTMAP
jgi:hypothetical protein